MNYVFDIGFDWNAPVSPGQQPSLNCGFVSFGAPTTALEGLQIGDTIGFNGFNQTPGASLPQYSILSGTITFSAVGSSPVSPFNAVVLDIYDQGATTRQAVSNALSPNVALPYWQSLITPQAIVNNGTFQFSGSLSVQGPDGTTKTFVLPPDPEMIVGSTN